MKKHSLVTIVLVFILVFTLISCNSEGEENNGSALSGTDISSASMTLSGDVFSVNVSSENEAFPFSTDITKAEGATVSISKNSDGSDPISGSAALEYGSNKFYITVKNGDLTKTYTANIYRAKSYKVSFDTLGGSEIDPVYVEEGAVAFAPETDPERKYYTFGGWDFDFSTAINENTVIKAKWSVVPELELYEFDVRSSGLVINAIKDKTVSEVVLPEDSYIIGASVFEGCENLVSVVIPENVTSIGKQAFKNCKALTDVTIKGNGLRTISTDAFSFCTSLKYIDIPESVTKIEFGAFRACSGIETMKLPFIGVTPFKSSDSAKNNVIGNLFGNHNYDGCMSITQIQDDWKFKVPSSLKHVTVKGGELCAGAFQNYSTIQQIVIEDDVKLDKLCKDTFRNCASLKDLVLPASFSEIEELCFVGDFSLTHIYYHGTEEDFASVSIAENNDDITGSNLYFYSDEQPEAEGNFWHFGEDGLPVAW